MASGRVIVTGTKEETAAYAAQLQENGFDALALPTIRIKKKALDAASIAALKDIESYDYLLVTSPHAAEFFGDALRDLWIRKPLGMKVAAVGSSTARALSAIGFAPHIIPRGSGVNALVRELKDVRGKKILFPRSASAPQEAIDTLRAGGAIVTPVTLYTTTPLAAGKKVFENAFKDAATDIAYVIFMSPSGVEGFAKNLHGNILKEHVLALRALAIGPTTAAAVKYAGFQHITIAQPSTFEGIVKTLRSSQHSRS